MAASQLRPLNGPEFTSMPSHGGERKLGLDSGFLRIAIAGRITRRMSSLYFLANS